MFDKSNDHDNFVPEDEEFLPLHDFLGEEKQGKVLPFKDNFGNNSDDLNYVKNINIRKIKTMIYLLIL